MEKPISAINSPNDFATSQLSAHPNRRTQATLSVESEISLKWVPTRPLYVFHSTIQVPVE